MIAEVRTKQRNLPVKTGTPEVIRDFFIQLNERKPGLYVLRLDSELVTLEEFEKKAKIRATDVPHEIGFDIKHEYESSFQNKTDDSAEEESDDKRVPSFVSPSEKWKEVL